MAAHDALIADAARRHLRPLGFQRKGRSRIWLQDHGWWLCVIEFQPSGWGKGSYLNVAAHWLWSRSGHLSFDYGGREAGFEPAGDTFDVAAERLATLAAEKAQRLTGLFASGEAVADTLTGVSASTAASWGGNHAAMAAALYGRTTDAMRLFDAITDDRVRPAAQRALSLVSDPGAFREHVGALVVDQRKALGLAPLSAEALWTVRASR